MSVHYREECEHGTIKTQCRCPGDKEVRLVSCFPGCSEYEDSKISDTSTERR